jgi:NAD(P)-dependent dehydrogenase (short-subunit alcohol dehydrogenase family)
VSSRDVSVVIGAGGIGAACAAELHRFDGTLVIADAARTRAADVVSQLGARPIGARAVGVDITCADSVRELAELAASLGAVKRVVLAAGVSPEHADVSTIVAVDLVGTARVLDVFGGVVAEGGAGVVIASLAGHIFAAHITGDQSHELATAPPQSLADLPLLRGVTDRNTAYGYAKRGNHLRVRSAAPAWARRGARINSVSPGVVDTEMGRAERSGAAGSAVEQLIAGAPIARAARPAEIAAAVVFLLSDAAGFVTGTDLLADGGALATFC